MSAEGRPVLILAGGTGGHIFPGIAVARELAARGVPVAWLGSAQGMESTLVPQAGIALERIEVSGLRGKGLVAKLVAPITVLRALWQAARVLRRLRPRAALALGGFAAGPGGVAAWLARVPLIVHEQNRVPGFTNRVLARFARRVLCGFPDAFPLDPRVEPVGNPVRHEIASVPPPSRRTGDPSAPLRVLVLGGSQGARALNRAVPAALARLGATPVEIRHQSGRALFDDARAAYAAHAPAARVEPFIDDMAAAYAWADLAICRAGALTLAELCAAGVPALLVPFPAAVDDHQTRNAEHLASNGAAILVRESDTLAGEIARHLVALAGDRPRLRAMTESAHRLARPDAAARIADACLAEARA